MESGKNLMVIWLDFDENSDSYYKYDDNGSVINTEKCGDLVNSIIKYIKKRVRI